MIFRDVGATGGKSGLTMSLRTAKSASSIPADICSRRFLDRASNVMATSTNETAYAPTIPPI